MTRFKESCDINGRELHGVRDEAEVDMKKILQEVEAYSLDDMYNMDEIGLFRK